MGPITDPLQALALINRPDFRAFLATQSNSSAQTVSSNSEDLAASNPSPHVISSDSEDSDTADAESETNKLEWRPLPDYDSDLNSIHTPPAQASDDEDEETDSSAAAASAFTSAVSAIVITAEKSTAETADETETEDASDVGRGKRVKKSTSKVRYEQAMAQKWKNCS